jgi:hypothetical protein
MCLPVIGIRADSPLVPEAEFMIRSGAAEFGAVAELIDNPTKIEYSITSWHQDGGHVIRTESDFHAIFPVPIEQVLSVLLDYSGQKKIHSNVVECIVLDAGSDPFDRHTVLASVGIRVLGFGDSYTYVTNNWVEQSRSGGYIQKYNLAESVDGKLYQMLGNWYIEPVDYEGRQYTYIRQYVILGIRRGSVAMELAMRTFGAMSLKRQFRNLSNATKQKSTAADSDRADFIKS